MFKVAETHVNFDYPKKEEHFEDTNELSSEELWGHLNANFNQILPFIE